MMFVRPAKPSDAPVLAAILSDWIDETEWMPRLRAREADARFVADMVHGGGVDVLDRDGACVGFLQETEGHVSALYLAPAVRGRNGGKLLLDAAKARSDRLDLWTFVANEGARRFYRREGFVEAEQSCDNDEQLPDVRMVWEREAG